MKEEALLLNYRAYRNEKRDCTISLLQVYPIYIIAPAVQWLLVAKG
jgi:uncharacterized membrane protein